MNTTSHIATSSSAAAPSTKILHWSAHVAPVGHFTVLRALPIPRMEAVGPFVFLDHFGPAKSSPETLPAHPHAGIEVMTFLLEGANEHRDSFGHVGVVQAGGAQWMRAGRGILHAETNLPDLAPTIHGLQIWARMPLAMQDDAPQYKAIQASDVPSWQHGNATLRLVGGRYGDQEGPIQLGHASVMLHLQLPAGSEVRLDTLQNGFEHGLYAIAGTSLLQVQFTDEAQAATAADVSMKRGDFAALPSTTQQVIVRNTSDAPADLMLLGGERAARPLKFGGPFVMDSQDGLMRAQERYFKGEMGTLDGVPF